MAFVLPANLPANVIFGGSFDPPHKGHSAIAQHICALDCVQHLFVVPTFLSPFKNSSLFSPDLRLQWAKIVFTNPKIIVSDFEITRGLPTPTLLTLQHLRGDSSDKYGIIIGADHLEHLHKWFGFESLCHNAVFIVFARSCYPRNAPILNQIDYCWIEFDCPYSSTHIRQGLQQANHAILESIDSTIAQQVWEAKNKFFNVF